MATAVFSGTPLPIATRTSSATSAATGSPNTRSGASLAIGLGVGLGVVAMLVLLALGWVFLRRRRRYKEHPTSNEFIKAELSGHEQNVVEADSSPRWGKEKMEATDYPEERPELQNTEVSAELGSDVYRVELPGSPVESQKPGGSQSDMKI